MTRILVGGELQIPYHSSKIFNTWLDFICDFNPDRIVIIGDFLDCPAPARWNRGTADEFRGNLQKEANIGQELLWQTRACAGDACQIDFHIGNHEKRIQTYVRTKAPAFAGLDGLKISSLLGFQKLGVNQLPEFSRLASGWETTHGDAQKTISNIGGNTALALARRRRRSIIMGHTHRLGMISESSGPAARYVLTGIETGHMMDVSKAGYISSGSPNWQSGFAAFEIDMDRVVNIRLVRVDNTGRVVS